MHESFMPNDMIFGINRHKSTERTFIRPNFIELNLSELDNLEKEKSVSSFWLMVMIWFAFAAIWPVFYIIYHDRKKARENLIAEWHLKLRAAEKVLGRKMSHEEIKKWLVYEWFKDRVKNADGFAREISLDYLPGKHMVIRG